MRAVLLCGLLAGLVGCEKPSPTTAESAAAPVAPPKKGAVTEPLPPPREKSPPSLPSGGSHPNPPAPPAKEPTAAKKPEGAKGREFTILFVNEQDFRREKGAIHQNEGAGRQEQWVKLTDNPAVVLAGEVEREFRENEVAATRKYVNKPVRVIGTAEKIFLGDDKTITVSIVRGFDARAVLSFPEGESESLEKIKPNDFVAVDGAFKTSASYERCRLVTLERPAMEGAVFNGHRLRRELLKLP